MGREIDETWIDEAIERYQLIEERLAELDRATKGVEVTVRSATWVVICTGAGWWRSRTGPGRRRRTARGCPAPRRRSAGRRPATRRPTRPSAGKHRKRGDCDGAGETMTDALDRLAGPGAD